MPPADDQAMAMAERMRDLRARVIAVDPHPVPAMMMVELIDLLLPPSEEEVAALPAPEDGYEGDGE